MELCGRIKVWRRRWLASNQLIQPLGLLRGGVVSSVQPAIGHLAVASIDLFLLGEMGLVLLMTFIKYSGCAYSRMIGFLFLLPPFAALSIPSQLLSRWDALAILGIVLGAVSLTFQSYQSLKNERNSFQHAAKKAEETLTQLDTLHTQTAEFSRSLRTLKYTGSTEDRSRLWLQLQNCDAEMVEVR